MSLKPKREEEKDEPPKKSAMVSKPVPLSVLVHGPDGGPCTEPEDEYVTVAFDDYRHPREVRLSWLMGLMSEVIEMTFQHGLSNGNPGARAAVLVEGNWVPQPFVMMRERDFTSLVRDAYLKGVEDAADPEEEA